MPDKNKERETLSCDPVIFFETFAGERKKNIGVVFALADDARRVLRATSICLLKTATATATATRN